MKQILFASLLLLLFAQQAHGQPSPQPQRSRTTAAATPLNYETNPFDLEKARLPENYRGHDLLGILGKFKVPAAKGEFEKTEEFDARMAKWQAAPFLGSLAPASLLAVEVNPRLAPDALKVDYDADDETFKIALNFENQHFKSGQYRWLETFYNSKNLGTRNATTRMGIKFQVKSFNGSSVGIAIPQSIEAVSLNFKFPRSDAPSVKPLIRAFAVVKLVDPYRVLEEQTRTASLDSPTEWINQYLGIVSTLEAVLVVNIRTGEVLARAGTPFATCSYGVC